MNKDNKSILQILNDLAEHSENMIFKSISKTILENQNNFFIFKIGTLANSSNSSISSVTRFCKFIGFSGFKDFYSHLEWELKLRNVEQKLELTNLNELDEVLFTKQLEIDCEELLNHQAKLLKKWIININPFLELLQNTSTIYLFGIGKMSNTLETFMLDLTWKGKKVVYSKDRDNQVHYSKNICQDDVAIFLDELMLNESLNVMLKNVSSKTKKIIIFSKNAIVGSEPSIFYNTFWEEKFKNIFNISFITMQLKILVEIINDKEN